MAIKTKPWDTAEFLNSVEDVRLYLETYLEDGDDNEVRAAAANAVRALARIEHQQLLGVDPYVTKLGPDDAAALLDALDNPSGPTEKLRAAFARHRGTTADLSE